MRAASCSSIASSPGSYGRREGLYVSGPFEKGTKEQGPQSPQTPGIFIAPACTHSTNTVAQARGLRRRARHSRSWRRNNRTRCLHGLESGTVQLEGIDGKTFFEQLLKDVQQGFFADPIYGGNHEMCAWKMIGFPGARYDYTDWVGRHNERYPYPPVSIAGRDDWNPAPTDA